MIDARCNQLTTIDRLDIRLAQYGNGWVSDLLTRLVNLMECVVYVGFLGSAGALHGLLEQAKVVDLAR